jgi:hypothetical protein
MKRALLKAGLGILAIAVFGSLAVCVWLLRYLESEAFQTALREQIETSLEIPAEIDWDRAEADLFSLSLDLHRPVLMLGTRSSENEPPNLRWAAESGNARIALGPLLFRRVELREFSLSRGLVDLTTPWQAHVFAWQIDDVELTSERESAKDPFSIRLSGRFPRGHDVPVSFSARGTASNDGKGGEALRFDEVTFRAVATGADGTDFAGTGRLLVRRAADAGLALETLVDLGKRGKIEIDATRPAEGRLDLRAELVGFDLALPKAFFADLRIDVAGFATGALQLRVDDRSADSIDLDLRVTDGQLRMPDYGAEGAMPVVARIENPFSGRPTGRIELDLSDAQLDYQGRFEKPAGIRANVTTTFSRRDSGEIGFESRFELRNLHQILSLDDIGLSIP